MVVGERQRRTIDPAGSRPEQPGGEPDQARLAASVRAGDLERFAGSQLKLKPSNSSRPPRRSVTSSNRSSARHAMASSSACMSSSLRPK